MSAITIPSTIPAELVAISAEALEARDKLLDCCIAIRQGGPITAENYPAAAATYTALKAFSKSVEEHRERIKAPVIALGRQIDAAAREACQAIEQERAALGVLVNGYEAKERQRVENEQRAARELARLAEIAERERQESALRAAAELAAPPGEAPAPVSVEDIRVRPVAAVYVPTFKGVTKATPKKKAVIINASLIPRDIDGICLVKEWDLAAITMLLKAGKNVAGCVMTDETTISATGR